MRQPDKKAVKADRRSFLKLAGAGVVGSGAALAATVTPAAAAGEPSAADSGTYRETDHVKRYYELAKFI
ncbi:MAG: formate dehydrogenase [Hyphomicrobiaceae bacterium]